MDPRHGYRTSARLPYSSQGCYGDCSGVGHKGSCSAGNSCSTEERTRPISTVQDRSQDSSGFSLIDYPRATERIRSRHRRLEDDRGRSRGRYTAALEDTTQDCQAKAADFEVYTNKSLSEELEALAKAKAVISEKTGDAEYRDNRSLLSSRGGLPRELTKSEHSIELAQLASCVDFAMHAEISNDDDPFAKVKGLISDMVTRLKEKAFADATHKAFEAKQINLRAFDP